MNVRRVGVCALVAWVASTSSAAAAEPDPALTARALGILGRYCGKCHGGPAVGASADQGGFDHVLDPERMASDGQLERFAPDRSEIVGRIRRREMPPAGEKLRPSRAELAIVSDWIAAGAAAPAPDLARAPRRAIGRAQVAARIAADLEAMPARRRTRVRYASLAHLHGAGRSDDELALARAALIKLLASTTWAERFTPPVAIDAEQTVYRIDLDAIGWSRAKWERIAALDPYAVASRDRASRAVRGATGTLVPVVSATWLVHVAARPPVYHDLLDLPATAIELERALEVVDAAAARAGFNGSGVSRHNRVIERRGRAGGHYYWRSYDFDGSRGRRNIFDAPIEFSPDGGEIIFSLPDGMQAYMLVDRLGRRLDRAPTQIVVDPARPDSAVENGISCIGCHARGVIDKTDQIRAHLVANRDAFERSLPGSIERALALYPPRRKLDKLLAADRGRFEAALARYRIDTAVEPMRFVAQRFEAELTVADAAAELGVGVDDLRAGLSRVPSLRRALGSLLVDGGTVKRDTFAAAFANLARSLELGEPLPGASFVLRRRLECDAGNARSCNLAGNAAYHGVAQPVDRAQAAGFYTAACRLGRAEGCNALAFVTAAGAGVARDRRRAAELYARACRQGSARGCEARGEMLFAGDGVAQDPRRAVQLLDHACRNGRARACVLAADALFAGRQVGQDRERAAALYSLGCEGDIAIACRRRGDQHLAGVGARLDWLRARRFYQRGCQLGDRRSCLAVGDVLRMVR